MFYSLGTSHSLGQVVLVGKKLLHNADVVDRNDHITIIEIIVEMNKILIANIYAPQTCFLSRGAKRY